MGTLVGWIREWLVHSNAFDPHVVNLLENPWQGRVRLELEAIPDGQFVHGRHREVEQFKKSV
uniref:Uncharacterized protein n=1 Tax=Romanomermis culicivorax TaxID=13658 RepID=A0A915L0A6_ROMCU